MTPERQAEIKEIIESVRKCGQVPYEVMKAMDEMMATIGALGEAEYVLNIDATWREKNKEIEEANNRAAMAEAFIDTLPAEMLAAWNRNVALAKLAKNSS